MRHDDMSSICRCDNISLTHEHRSSDPENGVSGIRLFQGGFQSGMLAEQPNDPHHAVRFRSKKTCSASFSKYWSDIGYLNDLLAPREMHQVHGFTDSLDITCLATDDICASNDEVSISPIAEPRIAYARLLSDQRDPDLTGVINSLYLEDERG
jgi:hypothetical protein